MTHERPDTGNELAPKKANLFSAVELAEMPPGARFPLKSWYDKMSGQDRITIENDMFNDSGFMAMETLFEAIDANHGELARSINNRFKTYLALKKTSANNKAALNQELADTREFITRKFDEISD